MAAAARPSESGGPASPDYISPCLHLHSSEAPPPSPSLPTPVSLCPSQAATLPGEDQRGSGREGGRDGQGTGNTRAGEKIKQMKRNKYSGAALSKCVLTAAENVFIEGMIVTGRRLKDEVHVTQKHVSTMVRRNTCPAGGNTRAGKSVSAERPKHRGKLTSQLFITNGNVVLQSYCTLLF